MPTQQTIIQNIRWAVFGKLLGQLISWTSTILVIRLLSPQDYGLVALAGIPIGIIAIVAGLGLDEVIVCRRAINQLYQRRALGALLLANALLYLFICLFSGVYADYFDAAELRLLLPILGLQLLIGCFGAIPSTLLERQLKIREITRVEITALIIASLCSLLLAYNSFGIRALVLNSFICVSCYLSLAVIFCSHDVRRLKLLVHQRTLN